MPGESILVLFNDPILAKDHPDAESEHTVVDIARDIAKILDDAGFRTSLYGLKADPAPLCRELQRRKPAAVFNLFEGNPDHPDTESFVAGILQWRGVPFTGSPQQALTIARNKPLAKQLLRGAGLPTADFMLVEKIPVPACRLPWPVFVKPAQQDASVGVDHASVCTNQKQLASRVAYILETYGAPVLVEEYIDGREINISLVDFPELHCLPPAEIHFNAAGPGTWPILTYAGKWHAESSQFQSPPPRIPADISPRLTKRLGDIAMRAFRLLECRDYARVDFRVRGNQPYILEVNPNPQISDETGFSGCLMAINITYESFIVQLVRQALNRLKGITPHFGMPGKHASGKHASGKRTSGHGAS